MEANQNNSNTEQAKKVTMEQTNSEKEQADSFRAG